MARHFKLLLYGEPNSGKSVFACRLPKPFFITTDGNYEYLEDFGADMNACKRVSSWNEAKEAFASDFEGYETVVIDLVEDLFKWCEYEFCNANKLKHISELPWSQGYDITRNEFINELGILFAKPKNIVLISHATAIVGKDRRGVEHTYFKPSTRIPDKVWPMLIGKMQYVLRCYCQTTIDENDKTVNNRYLSLVPKSDEYAVLRGIDENKIPDTIPLDPDAFLNIINSKEYRAGLNTVIPPVDKKEEPKKEEAKKEVKKPKLKKEEPKKEEKLSTFEENPKEVFVNDEPEEVKETQPEVKEEKKEEPKPTSAQDKLAAIRAKLQAARQNANK